MSRVVKHDKVTLKIQNEVKKPSLKIKYQDNCYIFVQDKNVLKEMIDKKFNKLYKKAFEYCLSIVDSDDANSGDLILSEIDKNILYMEKKYKEFLTEKELKEYIDRFELMRVGMIENLILKEEEKSIVR